MIPDLLPPAIHHAGKGRWPAAVERMVRGLDVVMKYRLRIYEYSQNDECLLRLSHGISDDCHLLADGTWVAKGESIGELHFWNERVPLIEEEGPDLAWAHRFQRMFVCSLQELAAYVETTPETASLKAFCGIIFMGSGCKLIKMSRPVKQCGFEMHFPTPQDGAWQSFKDFWENLYAMWLMWAFNPGCLKSKEKFSLRRGQVWISRRELLKRYGSASVNAVAPSTERTAPSA